MTAQLSPLFAAVESALAETRGSLPLPVGETVNDGEWVLAIGNPLGDNLAFTVTQGIISAKGRRLDGLNQGGQRSISDFIQTDAAINPGNSGGPLVNVRGEVIGINSAIASETGYYSGYGFAIPINTVIPIVKELVENGYVTGRPLFGAAGSDLSAMAARFYGLPQGVYITAVDPSYDSYKQGLREGDIAEVTSSWGRSVLRVHVTNSLRVGESFAGRGVSTGPRRADSDNSRKRGGSRLRRPRGRPRSYRQWAHSRASSCRRRRRSLP